MISFTERAIFCLLFYLPTCSLAKYSMGKKLNHKEKMDMPNAHMSQSHEAENDQSTYHATCDTVDISTLKAELAHRTAVQCPMAAEKTEQLGKTVDNLEQQTTLKISHREIISASTDCERRPMVRLGDWQEANVQPYLVILWVFQTCRLRGLTGSDPSNLVATTAGILQAEGIDTGTSRGEEASRTFLPEYHISGGICCHSSRIWNDIRVEACLLHNNIRH